jgi:L-ascorbate metabolism protein UlaG (beta-lactamase superfamily)
MASPLSDHFDGKRFFNPGGDPERGWVDLLRWKFSSRPEAWPREIGVTPMTPPAQPLGDGVIATWIGHSSILLQTRHGNYLIDPVYSERIGPVSWAGVRRVMPPAIPWSALPRIDAVFVSHDHYDHCDLPTLRRLAQRNVPVFAAPLGHGGLLNSVGAGKRILEMDWWQDCELPGGASVTLVPALHWCRRGPGGGNLRLWGGFVLRSGNRLVYYAGDTGYSGELFSEIGRRCGRPDLALLPIGAYEPRWFMGGVHMNPAEAVRAHRDVGARRSVGVHWGTFQLTDEGREAPLRALAAARSEAGIPEEQFLALPPGGSVTA